MLLKLSILHIKTRVHWDNLENGKWLVYTAAEIWNYSEMELSLLATLKSQTTVTLIIIGYNWKGTMPRESNCWCTHFARQSYIQREYPFIDGITGSHILQKIRQEIFSLTDGVAQKIIKKSDKKLCSPWTMVHRKYKKLHAPHKDDARLIQ